MKNFIFLIKSEFQINFLSFTLLTLYISFFFSCENNDKKSVEITPDIIDSSVVMQNGLLTVSGNKIVNKNNEPVSFAKLTGSLFLFTILFPLTVNKPFCITTELSMISGVISTLFLSLFSHEKKKLMYRVSRVNDKKLI